MSASAEGGIRFGQYVLLRRIARGGMAEVFLAQQRGLEGFDRRVAVKRILPHLADAPDFVKMFLGEARLAAQLTHPNIVHIYDFGKFDGDYFIAMEYIEGVHAGQLFKQAEKERMPAVMVARIGADAAAALHYAHELRAPDGSAFGLVHRDVSPANIMVSFDGVVKLCDFGIAKAAALGDQLTNPGQVKGKYAYMSPEQTIAAPLDGRSDVFSLAIVLWELLAGKTIVSRGDAVEAMRAIRDGKLPPIQSVAPWVPAPLAQALGWAMQTRREQRATAMDFAQALEAFIKSSPDLATPMQVAAWVRQRFPRDSSGAHTALPGPNASPHHGPRTAVAPGTAAAPRTLQTQHGTRVGTVTPASVHAAAKAISRGGDDSVDTSETLELDDTDQRAANQATVLDGSMRAAVEITDREGPIVTGDDEGSETVLRSGAYRPQVSGAGVAIPTRFGPTLDASPPPPPRPSSPLIVDTTAGVRRDRPGDRWQGVRGAWAKVPAQRRTLIAIAGLVGLALISFLIALAARSPARAVAGRDAGVADAARVVVAPAPADAALPEAPPDAAPLADAAEPTIRVDAAEETTILDIRTTPTGATVRVGDQVRTAPARFALPAGHYVVFAELDGYQTQKQDIDLVLGVDMVQVIALTKQRGGARPTTGKLTARTTPYSIVFSGTRRLAETPFADLELPAGTYMLTFKNPTREPITRKVVITAGKTTKLSFVLP